jgi:hypothetical protein
VGQTLIPPHARDCISARFLEQLLIGPVIERDAWIGCSHWLGRDRIHRTGGKGRGRPRGAQAPSACQSQRPSKKVSVAIRAMRAISPTAISVTNIRLVRVVPRGSAKCASSNRTLR